MKHTCSASQQWKEPLEEPAQATQIPGSLLEGGWGSVGLPSAGAEAPAHVGGGETPGCPVSTSCGPSPPSPTLPVPTGSPEPASQPPSSAARTGCDCTSRRMATTASVASAPSTKVGRAGRQRCPQTGCTCLCCPALTCRPRGLHFSISASAAVVCCPREDTSQIV